MFGSKTRENKVQCCSTEKRNKVTHYCSWFQLRRKSATATRQPAGGAKEEDEEEEEEEEEEGGGGGDGGGGVAAAAGGGGGGGGAVEERLNEGRSAECVYTALPRSAELVGWCERTRELAQRRGTGLPNRDLSAPNGSKNSSR